MKALLVVLALVLVFAHPVAFLAVLGIELAACALLGTFFVRRLAPVACPGLWRSA